MVTNNNESLKHSVRRKLDKLPEIKELFDPCIERRMQSNNWLNNILIQKILEGSLSGDMQRQIRIAKKLLTNYEYFKGKEELKGDQKDFDNQMLDYYAELRTLEVLNNKGYSKATAIKRESHKTPDFEIEKDGQMDLVEAKHMRDPDRILNYLWDRCKAESLKYPNLYNRLLFSIVPFALPRDISKTNKEENTKRLKDEEMIKQQINHFVPEVTKWLEKGLSGILPKISFQNLKIKVVKRNIDEFTPIPVRIGKGYYDYIIDVINTGKSYPFDISYHGIRNNQNRYDYLKGFECALWRKIEEAEKQLHFYQSQKCTKFHKQIIVICCDLAAGGELCYGDLDKIVRWFGGEIIQKEPNIYPIIFLER